MSPVKDSVAVRAEAFKSNIFEQEQFTVRRDDIASSTDRGFIADFHDRTISSRDWFVGTFDNVPGKISCYFRSLFPISTWIYRYNLAWFTGDLIAGLTVGAVVVPQGMSYAMLAGLSPEYGLYSSFIGVFIYCFFATSKDVTIGPVAVMSLEVAKIIGKVMEDTDAYAKNQIATALALTCGVIATAIGILRIGFILEFIPAPAVAGFMTGSAFTIAAGQIPNLLGIGKRLNTRQAAYLVVIDTLCNLKFANTDAAFGLTSLAVLYFVRWFCEFGSKRWPQYKRTFFFASVMRNGFVIVFLTLSSWVYVRGDVRGEERISIIKTVPRGFRNVAPPKIDANLIRHLGPHLPVATTILLLEHISIAKSFGRLNDYKIVPDQEVIAIGITNLIGTFFNAYPATGSFSRTALKSKSGVRTPAAGIITGIVVLLALYALTDAFYYIPNAGLSAVIVHAVGDLMAHPRQLFIFWRVQPLEAVIFLVAVFLTIFSNIENGIYWAIASSAGLLLYRVARPRGQFLGRVRLSDGIMVRDIYVPVDRRTVNPSIRVENPPPGVVVYRPTESFTYPNASTQCDIIVDEIKRITKRGKANAFPTLGDRPWNEPGPRKGFTAEDIASDKRPTLRALILDFSAVATIDTTGVQCLVDTRRQLNRYADREVEFHFANIISPWVRRSLIAGGFGTGQPAKQVIELVPVISDAEVVTDSRYKPCSSSNSCNHINTCDNSLKQRARRLLRCGAANSYRQQDGRFHHKEEYSLEQGSVDHSERTTTRIEWGYVMPNNTPFFHIDIPNLSLSEDDKKGGKGLTEKVSLQQATSSEDVAENDQDNDREGMEGDRKAMRD